MNVSEILSELKIEYCRDFEFQVAYNKSHSVLFGISMEVDRLQVPLLLLVGFKNVRRLPETIAEKWDTGKPESKYTSGKYVTDTNEWQNIGS